MSESSGNAWKKTEDIPRRFDQLPPAPDWIPVADVIRTQREDEARQEEQKIKIKPPLDSDSDSEDETQDKKPTKTQELKRGKLTQENYQPKDTRSDDKSKPIARMPNDPPTSAAVDNVTRSMIDWALNPDHMPKRAARPPRNQDRPTTSTTMAPLAGKGSKPITGKERSAKPLSSSGGQQRPTHLPLHKPNSTKERQSAKPEPKKPPPLPNTSHIREALLPNLQEPATTETPKAKPPPLATTTTSKEGQKPYEEPSPDYDDDNYDNYYSRYPKDQQYYDEELIKAGEYYQQDLRVDGYYEQDFEDEYYEDHGPIPDEYYFQEQGFEDNLVPDPHSYGAYRDESVPYVAPAGYVGPPVGDVGYDYGAPQGPHQDPRGYPESPYPDPPYLDPPLQHSQPPHPPSKYDVLY